MLMLHTYIKYFNIANIKHVNIAYGHDEIQVKLILKIDNAITIKFH